MIFVIDQGERIDTPVKAVLINQSPKYMYPRLYYVQKIGDGFLWGKAQRHVCTSTDMNRHVWF